MTSLRSVDTAATFLLSGVAYFTRAAAFCNRQRFFVAAMILFNPSGLILRFFFGVFMAGADDTDSLLALAHLALCAMAILLRPATLILRRFRAGSGVAAVPLELPLSIARSSAICSLRRAF
jgi:hypothetical protein